MQNIDSLRYWIWKKANAQLNLTNHEPDIDKICSYEKKPYEVIYQLLIKKERIQI